MSKKKEQYWQEHITGWRASGLSQADYCLKHGISKSTFWLWKRKPQQNRGALDFIEFITYSDSCTNYLL